MKTRKQLKSEIERFKGLYETAEASNNHLMELVKQKNEAIERLKNGDCEKGEYCSMCKHAKFTRDFDGYTHYICEYRLLCKKYEEKE